MPEDDPAVGGAPPPPEVPTRLLRGALEAAWAVARQGVAAAPPVEAPVALRPMLGWARLPPRSLEAVRRAVEGDDAFRERVAAAVDADLLEPPARLWLLRPAGWTGELASLVAEASGRHHAHEARRAERREERDLRRRVQVLEGRLAVAEEAAAASGARAEEAAADLAAWRSRARTVEGRLAHLEAERARVLAATEEARSHAGALAADLAAALRRAEAAEAAAEATSGELAEGRREIERLRARLAAAGAAASADAGRRRGAGAAVADAAAAAADLAAALARAAEALAPGGSTPGALTVPAPPPALPARGEPGPATGAPGAGAGGPARRRPPPGQVPAAAGRRPVPVPGGMFDDGAEWAGWLLRRPGILVLVDGYNVSLASWPAADLADQRRTLEAALGALAARTGAEVRVVFDASADEELPAPVGVARRPVKVSFSRTGEDADEVLIDLVAATPPSRPVAVVTDDRRVRSEVSARGANVLSVAQLHAVTDRR